MEQSKIEWTDHTVNLWWGCAKVHTGCKNCYAEYFSDTRYKKNLWGEKQPRQRIKSAFNDLDKYQNQAKKENKTLKIFCGSMMDIFEESKPIINPDKNITQTGALRNKLFTKINNKEYTNLIFLFLTKRPENIVQYIPSNWQNEGCPKNIWFGASVSDQSTYNNSISILDSLNFKCKRFLSVEPQTGNIEIGVGAYNIDWIIQGGESGHNKRFFNINWAYTMKSRCSAAKVAYFFKQIDKIQAIPEELKIQQFPFMEIQE